MRAEQLDALYSALSQALGRVGETAAPLFLATLALELMARQDDDAFALQAIERAERLTLTA
jgi:hypothetical protein